MITIKTVVTVSQDDSMVDDYKEKLAEPEWKVTESTMSVTFVQVKYYGEQK